MADTSFSVAADAQPRFTTAYEPDEATGGLRLLDPPVGGWWSAPPAMANAAGISRDQVGGPGPRSRSHGRDPDGGPDP